MKKNIYEFNQLLEKEMLRGEKNRTKYVSDWYEKRINMNLINSRRRKCWGSGRKYMRKLQKNWRCSRKEGKWKRKISKAILRTGWIRHSPFAEGADRAGRMLPVREVTISSKEGHPAGRRPRRRWPAVSSVLLYDISSFAFFFLCVCGVCVC